MIATAPTASPFSYAVLVLPHPVGPASQIMSGTFFGAALRRSANRA